MEIISQEELIKKYIEGVGTNTYPENYKIEFNRIEDGLIYFNEISPCGHYDDEFHIHLLDLMCFVYGTKT